MGKIKYLIVGLGICCFSILGTSLWENNVRKHSQISQEAALMERAIQVAKDKNQELITFQKGYNSLDLNVDGAVELEIANPTFVTLRFKTNVTEFLALIDQGDEKPIPLSSIQQGAVTAVGYSCDPFNDPARSGHSSAILNEVRMNIGPSYLENYKDIPRVFLVKTQDGKVTKVKLTYSLWKDCWDRKIAKVFNRIVP